MSRIRHFLSRFIEGDPLRKVGNVRDKNRVHNILEDIVGVNCRIEKPINQDGLGWRIIVDGSSDEPLPEGVVPPWSPTLIVDDRTTELDADGKIQLYDSDAGGAVTDPTEYDDDAVFPWMGGFGDTLKWASLSGLGASIGAYVAVDGDSIDRNADDEIELKTWADIGLGGPPLATPATDGMHENDAIPSKHYDGESGAHGYVDNMRYVTPGAIVGAGAVALGGADLDDGADAVFTDGLFVNAASWGIIECLVVDPTTGATKAVKILGKVMETL
jgi:hypothetical protein